MTILVEKVGIGQGLRLKERKKFYKIQVKKSGSRNWITKTNDLTPFL